MPFCQWFKDLSHKVDFEICAESKSTAIVAPMNKILLTSDFGANLAIQRKLLKLVLAKFP